MISFLLWQEGAHRGKEAGMSGHRKSHRGCLSAATGMSRGLGSAGAWLISPASSAWPGPGPPSQALGPHYTTLPVTVLR